MASADGWRLGVDGQALTSTIWPLKISSAFWISGSFLKSFLSAGADPDLGLVCGIAGPLPASAGLSIVTPGGGWGADPDAGTAGVTRFTGDSSFMNFTCAL